MKRFLLRFELLYQFPDAVHGLLFVQDRPQEILVMSFRLL
jgi:hypothetical protein